MPTAFLEYVKDDPIEHDRFLALREGLNLLRPYFHNRKVLDFGASYGLSICALTELGANHVIGVEPDPDRVRRGHQIIRNLGIEHKAQLVQISYDAILPFPECSFETVLANAVLERIPSGHRPYVREMWRVIKPGGYLIIRESPNKYLPIDLHTTGGLWLIPWMPKELARRYAIWRGRFRHDADWSTSGWRGIGYYEIEGCLKGPYKLISETGRLRHRLLTKLGLPASLFDPYPTLIFQKTAAAA